MGYGRGNETELSSKGVRVASMPHVLSSGGLETQIGSISQAPQSGTGLVNGPRLVSTPTRADMSRAPLRVLGAAASVAINGHCARRERSENSTSHNGHHQLLAIAWRHCTETGEN